MIGTSLVRVLKCTLFLLSVSAFALVPAEMGSLRAGAAEDDITQATGPGATETSDWSLPGVADGIEQHTVTEEQPGVSSSS